MKLTVLVLQHCLPKKHMKSIAVIIIMNYIIVVATLAIIYTDKVKKLDIII